MSEKKSKSGIVPQEYSVKGHLRAFENELTLVLSSVSL